MGNSCSPCNSTFSLNTEEIKIKDTGQKIQLVKKPKMESSSTFSLNTIEENVDASISDEKINERNSIPTHSECDSVKIKRISNFPKISNTTFESGDLKEQEAVNFLNKIYKKIDSDAEIIRVLSNEPQNINFQSLCEKGKNDHTQQEKKRKNQQKKTFSISPSNYINFITNEKIQNKYQFYQQIGEGAHGIVFKSLHKPTKELRAIKVIKEKVFHKNSEEILSQYNVLKLLDHPSIIKLYEIYLYRQNYYIITEYCKGGELISLLQKVKKFPESQARLIMKEILIAVNYLHTQNVVHRDLKPENILIEEKFEFEKKQVYIKLIDFGQAHNFKDREKITEMVGTPFYIAPEVIQEKQYSSKCDLWSCGIILYLLLSGCRPFQANSITELFQKIRTEEIKFKERIWSLISHDAKNLISSLLKKNPENRLNVQQALNHKWFTEKEIKNIDPVQKVQNLQSKLEYNDRFSAVVDTFLACNTISQTTRRRLGLIYKSINNDRSENKKFTHIRQHSAEPDQSSSKINFTEFLMATLNNNLHEKKALEVAFMYFDKNNSGYLQREQLKDILQTQDSDEINSIMNDFTLEKRISKQDFIQKFQQKS